MSAIGDREPILPGDSRRPSWMPEQHWRYGGMTDLIVFLDGNVWREAEYGQYVLPGYALGKPGNHDGLGATHQRVTTHISMAEYQGDGLIDYGKRNMLGGLYAKPELLFEVVRTLDEIGGLPQKHIDDEDTQRRKKAALKELAARIEEAAGANEANQNGSEIHAATELVDIGTCTPDTLPAEHLMADGRIVDLTRWRKHVLAYVELRDGRGDAGPELAFQVFPELVERTINPSRWGTVGTFDRLVLFKAPKWMTGLLKLPEETEPRFTILDVKSGDVDYRDKFGRQMTTYAHAEAMWDFEKNCYDPMPEEVNQDYGLVAFIPWWEENPEPELIPVPLIKAAGLEGLAAADTVKRTRSYAMKAPVLKSLSKARVPGEEPAAKPVKKARARKAPALPQQAAEPKFESAVVESVWIGKFEAATSQDEISAIGAQATAALGGMSDPIKVAGRAAWERLQEASVSV